MRLDPALGIAQVLGHARVDDRGVLAADARHAVLFQDRDGAVDHLGREMAGVGRVLDQRALGAHGRRGAARSGDLLAVQHVGAGVERVADQLLLRLRGGCAHLLGRTQDHVVIGAQLQLVGDGGIGAVLVDTAGDGAHAELLARGDHALGQLACRGEGVPLAPLHGALVVLRQALALGELRVELLHARVLQQLGVVKLLHLGGQGVAAGEGFRAAVVGVHIAAGRVDQRARVGKKLNVKIEILFHSPSFPVLGSSARRQGERCSPLCPAS